MKSAATTTTSSTVDTSRRASALTHQLAWAHRTLETPARDPRRDGPR